MKNSISIAKGNLAALKTGFSWVVLLHSAAFCLFWLTNRGYHPQVNDFLAGLLGMSADFVSLFVGFSLVVLAFSLVAIGLGLQQVSTLGRLSPALILVTRILGGIFILFFYGSFAALFRQDPTQVERLKLLAQTFRWLLDTLVLVGAAWALSRWLTPTLAARFNLPPVAFRWTNAGLLAGLWALPILWQPGGVIRGELPAKPLLIAHRGASWLAPENTLAAMDQAASLGAYALESDVHVSTDGVLFLMHDQSLKRTTDVEALYPTRRDDHAASFSWDELSRLNAGEWFVKQDPYGTIRSGLSVPTQTSASQTIPTLQDLLKIASTRNTVALYDLYDPPEGHPYHKQSLTLSLAKLGEAQLGERAWVLAREDEISQVRAALPEATLVAGIDAKNPPPAKELAALGYKVVNSEYPLRPEVIRSYREAGLWVNLWTVDEPWLYSRCWLLGVNSVTTNNLHGLNEVGRPFLMPPMVMYAGLWAAAGLLAAWILRSSIPSS